MKEKLPAVAPAGGFDNYEKRREERYIYSPFAKSNFKKYSLFIKDQKRSDNINYLPWKYQIEPNSTCNLNCVFCAVSQWDGQKRAEDMSVKVFKNIIDENEALLEVNMTPLGEPLMRGNDLFEMIKFSKEKRIWTRMTTNGTLLHINDNAKKLMDSDLDEIVISIDSFNSESYERMRKGSKFKRVMNNVSKLHELMEKSGKGVNTKCNIVITNDNRNELEKIAISAINIGFRNLSFTVDAFSWGVENLKVNNVSEQITHDRLMNIHNLHRDRDVYIGFVITTNKFTMNSEDLTKRCSWPYSSMYIGSDSTYVPCCHIGDPRVYSIRYQGTPLEAWRSSEYMKFRNMHTNNSLPSVCKECYSEYR